MALVTAVEGARATAEARFLDIVRKAATGWTETTTETSSTTSPEGESQTTRIKETQRFSPQSAQWALERSWPDKWGHKARVEHSGEIQETRRVIVEVAGGGTIPALGGGGFGALPPPSSEEEREAPVSN